MFNSIENNLGDKKKKEKLKFQEEEEYRRHFKLSNCANQLHLDKPSNKFYNKII